MKIPKSLTAVQEHLIMFMPTTANHPTQVPMPYPCGK